MFEFHGNGIFIDHETMVMNLISSVAGIALFVGGLKTLRLRPIGRTILIWYCMFTLAFSVINAVMTYNLIKSAMTSGIANATSANLGPPPELFEIIVGVVFTYAIAGSILYYLTRSSIKNLFEDTLFLSERRVPGANS